MFPLLEYWFTCLCNLIIKRIMKKYLLLAAVLFSPLFSLAQCSMCKAVAETADEGGFGAGLNYGILYLMIFPYLIIGGIAFKMYRAKKLSK